MENFKSTMISNDYANRLSSKCVLSQTYHQNTKHSQRYLMRNMYQSRVLLNSPNFLKATQKPERYFPTQQRFKLNAHSSCLLTEYLDKRRSQVQSPDKDAFIDLNVVSDLFWAAYGKNSQNKRVVPSAGALYPLEIYGIVFNDYENFKKGLYHYNPSTHALSLLDNGAHVFDISKYILRYQNMEHPSIIFFITAVFSRATFKYDDRAYRYILLEAGAVAQNIALIATHYNLVSTSIGGTDDFKVEEMLKIDGNHESIVDCVFITKDREAVL